MKKRKYTKRIVAGAVLFLFVVCYVSVYMHAYNSTRKTEVKYYDMGEKVVYGGVEYEFEAEKYTADELIDKFSLDSEKKKIQKIDDDISGIYIVTTVHAKRIEECSAADKVRENMIVLNKYMDGSGRYEEILDMIQMKAYVHDNELKPGEETEYYMLNVISRNSYCDEVWSHVEEAAFYIEFPDYESREYITRIKVIDGKYGVF